MKVSDQKRAFGGALKPLLLSSAAAMIGIAAMLPTSAIAQTAKPSAADAEDSSGLEDIVVTAQRRSQAVSQVPISVQALAPTQVERLGPVDTTALTQLSPSVTFRPGYSANSSSFAIRGVTSIGINGGIQPSTAIVIDGMPLYKSGEMIADFSDLKSLEILRGPQGTLFGKNSTAGVVNITTGTPTAEFAGKIQAGITTDTEWFTNAMLNVPLGEKVQLRLTGYYRDQRPLIKNRGIGGDLYGAESYGFGGKIKAELSDSVDFLLSGNYTKRTGSYGQHSVIIPLGGALTGVQSFFTGINYGYGNLDANTNGSAVEKIDTSSVIGQIDWRASDTITVTSVTGYRHFFGDNYNDVDATPAGSELGKPYTAASASYFFYSVNNAFPRQPDKANYFSQELRLNYDTQRTNIVAGVFYQTAKNTVGSVTPVGGPLLAATGNFTPFFNASFVDSTLKNNSASVFADVTYKLTDTFSMFAGARYTHETISNTYSKASYFVPLSLYNPLTGVISAPPTVTGFAKSQTEDNLSGRVGLQWRPTEGQNYYASYNRGYKGPAINIGNDASLATAITGPETADAFEIGTKQKLLDNKLQLSLSLYSQKINGVQQSSLLPGTISSVLANAGDLKSKGAEFEFQWLVADGLRLSGGVAYTDAKYSGNGEIDCYPGQTVAQGCVALTSNPAQFHQFLAGQTAINAPKWRYNISADYETSVSGLGKLAFNVGWVHSTKVQYALNQNPTTIEPAHGFLNASVTLITDHGFELQVFGRNLTDEFYYGTRAFASIFGTAGYPGRDFKRYAGISAKYSF